MDRTLLPPLGGLGTRTRMALVGAVTALVLAAATLGGGTPTAEASCGKWKQTSPNRIVSHDADCTRYFKRKGWHVIAVSCVGELCGKRWWRLARDR